MKTALCGAVINAELGRWTMSSEGQKTRHIVKKWKNCSKKSNCGMLTIFKLKVWKWMRAARWKVNTGNRDDSNFPKHFPAYAFVFKLLTANPMVLSHCESCCQIRLTTTSDKRAAVKVQVQIGMQLCWVKFMFKRYRHFIKWKWEIFMQRVTIRYRGRGSGALSNYSFENVIISKLP